MYKTAVKVQSLTKYFGPVKAVEDLNFVVPTGTTTALLGGNGAGKTTTISILLGLLLPSSGSVTILGENLLRDRYRILPKMNFASPYVDLPRRLTTAQNLKVYAGLYGLNDAKGRLKELSAELELESFMDRQVGRLSAGQKTRVALAKALINKPELLLLDEPTASLDPDSADWIRTYLKNYQCTTKATILLTSHNMREVEQICDDVIIMESGRLLEEGAPKKLVERYGHQTLEEVFLDIARRPISGE